MFYSHPIAGQYWNIDFTTMGASDLTITPADQSTIDDMQFTSLKCGDQDLTGNAQILEGNKIYYPNWSCDDVATASFLDLKTGHHQMTFNFGVFQRMAVSRRMHSTAPTIG